MSDIVADREIDIIDFGCATGLVGAQLLQHGLSSLGGIDISTGVLTRAAEKQVYRHLFQGVLTRTIPLADASYDAGCCLASMGAGHVASEHCAEMIRCIRPAGIFIIIINGMHYVQGFDRAFAKIQGNGLYKIRRLETINYMARLDRTGWLLVAEICA